MSEESGTLPRPNVPEADRLIGVKQPLLSHGYVVLMDYMGDDNAIVQAARVSYGRGTKSVRDDRGLIRYLMRHRHTTPFEMVEFKFLVRLPIYVARQWIRHRTACLAEGTELWFDSAHGARKGSRGVRKVPIEEVWRRFVPAHHLPGAEPTTSTSLAILRSFGWLRQMNETTQRVQHTCIVDVFRNGMKPVFRMRLTDGRTIHCTADHRFRFPDGWKTLHAATGLREMGGQAIWKAGRYVLYVDSTGSGQERREMEPISTPKGPSPPEPALPGEAPAFRSVDLSRATPVFGEDLRYSLDSARASLPSSTATSKRGSWPDWLGLRSPISSPSEAPSAEGPTGRTPKPGAALVDHGHTPGLHEADDQIRLGQVGLRFLGRTPRLSSSRQIDGTAETVAIQGFDYLGIRMTYDIEVEGPFSNFIANGIVTHNSINEYSARYSIVPDEFDLPPADEIRRQSSRNRQGRSEALSPEVSERFRTDLDRISREAYQAYSNALSAGVARETARLILPLAYYTEWYWKVDLWNLLHFLSLRLDPHAQEEIRLYAAELAKLAQVVCPAAFEAFEDFTLGAMALSRKEQQAVRALLSGATPEEACRKADLPLTREDGKPMSSGEGVEFLQKLERLRADA